MTGPVSWPITGPVTGAATPALPPVLGVTGGAFGMAVATEHALVLASDFADVASSLGTCAAESGRALSDPDLLASAPWSPDTFADAEAAVLAATVGPGGATAGAAEWEALALAVRLAVRATRLTDGMAAEPIRRLDAEVAGRAADVYPSGHAHVRRLGVSLPGSTTPPGDLASLVQHLAEVNALSDQAHPELDGTIEVQTIRSSDGSVRHVVYLPGTDDPLTTPSHQDGDVRDLGTNLRLVSGRPNAYQDGILAALHQAGVRPGEPVALVGHSQGGMAAAAILAEGSPYDVTTVVTAGAPFGVDGFPAGTHVLSLENQGDVIPLLDGRDNADSAQQVTVRFTDGGPPGIDAHSLDHFVHGAAAAQACGDPSVEEQLDSLRRLGFTGGPAGEQVTSQVFQITRVP